MRNHANDFIKCQGAGIRVSELVEYCKWAGLLSSDDKRALHAALTMQLGASVVERRFWRSSGPFNERAYAGIYWNLDAGFPDFEQFWNQSTEVKEYTPTIGEPL